MAEAGEGGQEDPIEGGRQGQGREAAGATDRGPGRQGER